MNGLPLNISDVEADISVEYPGANLVNNIYSGLCVRVVNSANFLYLRTRADIVNAGSPNALAWELIKVIGGVPTVIDSGGITWLSSNQVRMKLRVSQPGEIYFRIDPFYPNPASLGINMVEKTYPAGTVTELQPGGTLTSGGVYIYDQYTGAAAVTRDYDDFRVSTSIDPQAMYSGRSLILDTKGCLRQASDGSGYGPVVPEGDTIRVPVSGKEQRTVELLLFSTLGDFHSYPEPDVKDFSAVLKYRPCWTSVPEA
jgi:hypothetical protein